jgi:hypothetical protein
MINSVGSLMINYTFAFCLSQTGPAVATHERVDIEPPRGGDQGLR